MLKRGGSTLRAKTTFFEHLSLSLNKRSIWRYYIEIVGLHTITQIHRDLIDNLNSIHLLKTINISGNSDKIDNHHRYQIPSYKGA